MIKIEKRVFTHFDYILPLLVIPVIILSHILISDANAALGRKQLVYFIVGIFCFVLFFVMPVRKLQWLIASIYWINIILLISVDIFGISKLGAQRWLEIPFVHFTIQPSEIMKPAFLLMLAYKVMQKPPPKDGYALKDFIKLSFYIILPFVLIMKEPDLGTAMVLLLVGFGVLFLVGVNRKIWISILAGLIALSPIIYENLHDYQKKRIVDFISKESSYQVKQSIIAIGSGGMFGKPKDEVTQTKFKFLPIATSDFIFAYNIERFGFLGGVIVMAFYLMLIMHLLGISSWLKKDHFASVFACGVGIMIFIYAGVNISMTVGLAPVVGIPLPFFSYGGSSFITFMCLFGILQNLVTFRYDHLYSSLKIKF